MNNLLMIPVIMLFFAGGGSKQGVFPVLGKKFGTVMEIEGVLTDKPLGKSDYWGWQTRHMKVLYVDNIKQNSPIDIAIGVHPKHADIKSGTLMRVIGYESIAAVKKVAESSGGQEGNATDHYDIGFASYFHVLKRLPESRTFDENTAKDKVISGQSMALPYWAWLFNSCRLEAFKAPHGIFPVLSNEFGSRITVQGKLINNIVPGTKAAASGLSDYSLVVSKVNNVVLGVKINIRLENLQIRPAMPTGGEATLVGREYLYPEGVVTAEIEDVDKNEFRLQMIVRGDDFAIESIFYVDKIENISLPNQGLEPK